MRVTRRPLPGRRVGAVRGWPLWSLPHSLVAYIATVAVLAVAAGVALALGTHWRAGDVGLWSVLVGAGIVCIEATRRSGERAGIAKDLLSAWKVPVLLLLPPVYALLAPVPLTAAKQLRGLRSRLHRRVLTAAATSLADCTASLVFHRLLPTGQTPAGWLFDRPLVALPAAGACAALSAVLNVLLVSAAVRMASPEATWRSLLLDREDLTLDGADACAGVLVAVGAALSPLMAAFALPPVLLLHRSLTHAQLRAAARVDPKTGLLNAVAWQEEADREMVRASRESRPVAVLIADLDHFKRVNDEYGHLVGDRMLCAAAAALQAALRPYDVLGRFGGEEFTVLLPSTDRAEAARIAERVRHQVAASPLVLDDASAVHVTVSVGGAVTDTAVGVPDGRDLTDLLAAADHALYQAKNSGRDRVSISRGPTAS